MKKMALWLGLLLVLAVPGLAEEPVAYEPGTVLLKFKIEAVLGGHEVAMSPSVATVSGKEATITVDSDDKKRPLVLSVSCTPVVEGKLIHLKLSVRIQAGERSLQRSLELTTPDGQTVKLEDKNDENHERFALSVLSQISR